MNGSIRVSAKTVNDAITEASIQLGVPSDKLEYEVIEKGSPGFLGIGMKQAVIEARRKPEPEPEPEPDLEPIVDFSLTKEEKKEVKPEPKKEKGSYKKKDKSFKKEEKPAKKEPKEVKETREVKEEVKDPEKKVPERQIREEVLAEVKEETIAAVEKFLRETFSAMNLEVQISSKIDEDGALSVNMEGEHMGILIGKRGQTLDALQYLANRVANKHQDGYVRVKLDTENYRERREETLKHLAKNMAHKVKRTRRPASLEPMNPYERRIIHSALQSDPYVTTHSEGDEPYRKVVVTLKR